MDTRHNQNVEKKNKDPIKTNTTPPILKSRKRLFKTISLVQKISSGRPAIDKLPGGQKGMKANPRPIHNANILSLVIFKDRRNVPT